MTDKAKAVFILILLIAFMLAFILSGCSVNPKDDICKTAQPEHYQLIPSPKSVEIPDMGEYDKPRTEPVHGSVLL